MCSTASNPGMTSAIRIHEPLMLGVMELLCMPRLLCSRYRTIWSQQRMRPLRRTPPSIPPTSLPSKQRCRIAHPSRTAKTLSSWWSAQAGVPSSQLPCRYNPAGLRLQQLADYPALSKTCLLVPYDIPEHSHGNMQAGVNRMSLSACQATTACSRLRLRPRQRKFCIHMCVVPNS